MRRLLRSFGVMQSGLAILLLFAVFYSGCNQQKSGNEEGKAVSTEEEKGEASVHGEDTVKVILTEFEIKMPNKITSGAKVFQVFNKGKVDHNFQIQGQGIDEKFNRTCPPNDKKSMKISLKPGNYHILCPVGNHEMMGMETNITVVQ